MNHSYSYKLFRCVPIINLVVLLALFFQQAEPYPLVFSAILLFHLLLNWRLALLADLHLVATVAPLSVLLSGLNHSDPQLWALKLVIAATFFCSVGKMVGDIARSHDHQLSCASSLRI